MYPIDSGGAHAQLVFIESMKKQVEIDLLIRPENIDAKDIASFRERFPHINLLQAGYQPAGFGQKLFAFFRKLFRKLAGKDPSYQLRKYGFLNTLIRSRPDQLQEIRRIAAAKSYDIIQVEHSIHLGLIELLPKGPKKIFVHHEIAHTRVLADMLSRGFEKAAAEQVADTVWQLEKGWLSQYDGIITLSPDDAALLQARGIAKPMQIAEPFALFTDELKKIFDPQQSPQLLFIGGEAHYPNKEGLNWFLQDIFPLIVKEEPDCSIRITGNWSDTFKAGFATDSRIHFLGFVDSLEPLYRDSVLVVPVRIGSGVRIKVITALAHGLPVVGTHLGLSGIPGIVHQQNVLMAEDHAAFAQQVLSLLRDPSLRESLSEQGFRLAEKGYAGGGFAGPREAFYRLLCESGKASTAANPGA